MREKTDSIILAVLTAIGVILPHAPKIIPEGDSLIAAAAVAATLSIPSKSAAAIMPARIVQLAVATAQSCDAGVMEQLCSSVTSFLNDEAAKTDADLKACKDKCGWKKRKDDLIDAARKKAKESCSKGEAPDVNELSKGLDRNTKDRLKDLYNRNSRMFDGTAKLKAVDFNAASSKNTAITGKTASLSKGGNVTDLKSSEPAVPKFSQTTEFSLASAKTASAVAVKASPESCYPEAYIAKCTCMPPNDNIVVGYDICYGACVNLATDPDLCPAGGVDWTGLFDKYVKKPWNVTVRMAKDQIISVLNWLGGNVENIKDWISDKYHELFKDEIRCGTGWYNPDKQCCVKEKVFNKCGGHCMPPSEYAVFMNNDCQPGFNGYCKTYNIYFRDSKYLDLAGVYVGESFKNKRQVDKRPICYPGLPEPTSKPLERHPNGLFAITDTLGISAEVNITTPCAHQFDQEIMVGGCRIQTNILTFEADPSGARRIFRSDEPTIGPKQ